MENKIIRKCSTHGKEYKLEFPITIPAVIQNPIQLVKLELSSTMRQSLKDIILNRGDEQNRLSNVKADMTDWHMHQHYQEFMQLSLLAETQAKLLTKNPVPTFTFECWGAVYRKDDETVIHNHWGNLWSWGYYLEIPNDSPPFRFEDTFQSGTNDVTSFDIYPEVDDLLIFPSWFKHSVPKMECDVERIMIAGNIQTVRPVPWPTPIKPTSISWSLENYD